MTLHPPLYDQDFYAWTQQQAVLLRARKWHDLDYDNLAEELEALGKRDRRELEGRLEVLIMHLLKWHYQPGAEAVAAAGVAPFGNNVDDWPGCCRTARACVPKCPCF